MVLGSVSPALHGAPPGGRSPETMLVDSIAWNLQLSRRTTLWRLGRRLIVILASKEATQHPMPFAKRWCGGEGAKRKVGKRSTEGKKVSQAKNGIHVMTTQF